MKDGCILAGVVSYPPGTTQMMLIDLRDRLVLPFLKKKWGNDLRCVIGHNDEYFWDDEAKKREPHYQDHFYVIPDAEGKIRLTSLHAGKVAKNKALAGEIVLKEEQNNGQWIDKQGKFVMKAYPIPKKEDEPENKEKRGNGKHSDRAYRDAMRQEQDEFYSEVGEPAGWERTTIKGVRYPREQVKAWKQNQRKTEAELKDIKQEIERQKTEAEKLEQIIKESQKERERLIKDGQKEAARILMEAKDEAKNKAALILKKENEVKKREDEAKTAEDKNKEFQTKLNEQKAEQDEKSKILEEREAKVKQDERFNKGAEKAIEDMKKKLPGEDRIAVSVIGVLNAEKVIGKDRIKFYKEFFEKLTDFVKDIIKSIREAPVATPTQKQTKMQQGRKSDQVRRRSPF